MCVFSVPQPHSRTCCTNPHACAYRTHASHTAVEFVRTRVITPSCTRIRSPSRLRCVWRLTVSLSPILVAGTVAQECLPAPLVQGRAGGARSWLRRYGAPQADTMDLWLCPPRDTLGTACSRRRRHRPPTVSLLSSGAAPCLDQEISSPAQHPPAPPPSPNPPSALLGRCAGSTRACDHPSRKPLAH